MTNELRRQLRRDKTDLLTDLALGAKRSYPIASTIGHDFLVQQLAIAVGTKIVPAQADCRTMLQALDDMGLAVVPKEPTEEMLAAGQVDPTPVSTGDVWRAMVAAAPRLTTSGPPRKEG